MEREPETLGRISLHDGGRPLRIHLIGVAGSGMSGLASLLMGLGHEVSGSDRVSTVETERMERVGLRFSSPHTAQAVADAELVIYSSAVKKGNLAYDAAIERGVALLRRAEALAEIMRGKKGIVVAGTHGKTTTSAMAAHVLREAGLRSSHYVGAEIPLLGTNAHWDAEGDYMVAEGDESDGTLVNFSPHHAILLNVEAEHLDFYRDLDAIREVFGRFLGQATGKVIYCAEDAEANALCAGLDNGISYGCDPEFDFSSDAVEIAGDTASFDVIAKGVRLGRVCLGIPGAHNVLNALSVIALATELGIPFEKIAASLFTFRGARRRFEEKYRSENLRIVDDYGHHPTEIAVTIKTALGARPRRLVCLFQPHRYSRTKLLRKEFGAAFAGAHTVFVTDVYPASEEPIPGISGRTIIEEIEAAGGPVVFDAANLDEAHLAVGNYLKPGDFLLTLGAGNVHEAATRIAADAEVLDGIRSASGEQHLKARLYEPMKNHTTLRVGGPAQFWIEPATVEGFAAVVSFCHRHDVPLRVIGRGSNLLVLDGGIPGVVIHPSGGEFDEVIVRGDRITAGVGARFKKLTSAARAGGLGGFEWMEGIPGNVGGGLRMNAGAMGCATFDHLVSVRCVDPEGRISEKAAADFESHYRNVPELRDKYAVSAVFTGIPASAEEIEARINDSRSKRQSSQPVAASAGCIFKNPEGCSAGMIVEELGLKNARVGAARVSEVHGNFIVNDGGASAREMLSLIGNIVAKAKVERDIDLETEVQIVGEDELFASGKFVIAN
ncbi:MAG: UDP-N-acetylmuramate--L-alanine ligase [Verrucomicrobiales bacterium]